MAISTKKVIDESIEKKREKILSLMHYHKPLFKKENVLNPKFIPRLCYPYKEKKVVSFYPKELYGGVDIYIEFCDRDYVPEDSERTLWKWVYNPDYSTEYELSDPHPATKDRRYIIPVNDLINVTELYKELEKVPIILSEAATLQHIEDTMIAENMGTGSDIPYDALTLRDYAAIQWKKPVSYKPWLNELITNTFKNE